MNLIKKILIKTPILRNVFEYLNKIRITGTLYVSLLSQKEKADLILYYAKKYNCKTFVETGTYKGDTVDACKEFFDTLYSIELSHDLYTQAKNRFLNINKINILEGNSGDVLPNIIKDNNQPILFWLDAHYSGGETARGIEDSPVVKEIMFILNNRNNDCILIDDARCFNGKAGYPTINTLKKIIRERNNTNTVKLHLQVKNDIIRISY